ncbi:MAG: GNAT family N-acetyltransferase [Deltaproteobacteria bacterium]|nr:GNAT family N-acetyltransferase [Deltaproteobacteria bacterium]
MTTPETEPPAPAGVSIRPARRKDRGEVLGMSLALLEEHRRSYGSDMVNDRGTHRQIRRTVSSHIRKGAVLVAEREGALIGFVLLSRARFVLRTARPTGSITDIYVEPGQRGRGVGSSLLGAGLAWLRSRGYHRVLLNVTAGNPARKLYERAGFRPFAESMEIKLD